MKPARQLFLVYGTPRCGSSEVSLLVANLLKQKEPTLFLGEFFNPRYRVQDESGQLLEFDFKNRTDRWLKVLQEFPDSLFQMHQERILALTHPRIQQSAVIKIFPNTCADVHTELLFQKSKLLFVYRRDLWAQLLSFVISRATDIWHSDDLRVRSMPKSLRIERKLFDSFVQEIQKFWATVEKHDKAPRLALEDWSRGHANRALSDYCELDSVEIKISAPQGWSYPKAKIENQEELKTWLECSDLLKLVSNQ